MRFGIDACGDKDVRERTKSERGREKVVKIARQVGFFFRLV